MYGPKTTDRSRTNRRRREATVKGLSPATWRSSRLGPLSIHNQPAQMRLQKIYKHSDLCG